MLGLPLRDTAYKMGNLPLVRFHLVYDRDQQKLVVQCPFSDSGEAVSAYERMEQEHRDDSNEGEVLSPQQVARPAPVFDDVRVRARRAGISPARTDIYLVRRRPPRQT